MNKVLLASYVVIGLGVVVLFGVFDRIGPIDNETRMKRLGWGIVALGILIALTQSTPTP